MSQSQRVMRLLFLAATFLHSELVYSDAKNIILMISDGAGFNTFEATAYYQDGRLGVSPYNQAQNGHTWVSYACTTYPSGDSFFYSNHTPGDTIKNIGYNAVDAWDTDNTLFRYPEPYFTDRASKGAFAGYNYMKAAFTDSAAAATAIATGHKSVYWGLINWDYVANTPIIPSIAEVAKKAGKKVGTISCVMFSDATPAAFSNVHIPDRSNFTSTANQMLNGHVLDVIMGCGNPNYDDNGNGVVPTYFDYVGGQSTWDHLENGTHPGGWNLIQNRNDFEALAKGMYIGNTTRLLGVPQVGMTLQANRDPAAPLNPFVPTLEIMTRASLRLLDNPNGFFLQIEGGAVDDANHYNKLDRMIEEQIDFNHSIQAVIDWVNANSNWEETLLIVTADHECGLLWGPNSGTIAFDPIVNNGQGCMPGALYNSGDHTNSLVPLFALGYGAHRFAGLVDGIDPVRGAYVDNTDIFIVMNNALCQFAIAGDLNKDCTVNLSDLAIISANWLVDCHFNPSDPACVPKGIIDQ